MLGRLTAHFFHSPCNLLNNTKGLVYEMGATSENLFFSHRDAFLNMTIFLSLKGLCTLRKVCKSFNSWLSDPNTFSWKQRIRSAFPLSYERILQQSIDEQMQRLVLFDTMIEAGHQVSYYALDKLTCTKPADRDWSEDGHWKGKHRLPWNKDLFIIAIPPEKNSREQLPWSVVLFNASTKSVTARIDLRWQPAKFVFNVGDRQIGFAPEPRDFFYTNQQEVKLYSVIDNCKLVHERDIPIPPRVRDVLPRMFGDCLIFQSFTNQDKVKFSLYSVSQNAPVSEVTLYESMTVFTAMSWLEPAFYTCSDENTVRKIVCENLALTAKKVYSDDVKVDVDDEGHGVVAIKLIENERSKFLRIYQSGCGDNAVDILALNLKRVIFSQHNGDEKEYSDDEDGDKKSSDYYEKAWRNLQINLTTPYYSTTSGEYGVVTVCNSNYPANDYDDTAEIHSNNYYYDNNSFPDKPAYFSKCYPGYFAASSQWLNTDILTFKLAPCTGYLSMRWRNKTFKMPSKPRQMFFSIAKREVIGSIDDDIDEIFVDGNNVIAFTTQNEVYEIKLDMSYAPPRVNQRKRKLSENTKDRKVTKKSKK